MSWGLSADIAMASGNSFSSKAFREESTMSILFRITRDGSFPAPMSSSTSFVTSSTPSLFGPGHALAGREVLEPCQLHLKLRFFGASMPMKNLEDDGRPIVNLHAGRFSNVSDLRGG